MSVSDSATGAIKLALTVDDLFQWKGTPELAGYPYQTIARRMTDAFNSHGAKGVYAFSNTAPVDDDRALNQVFDGWADAGHHIGNHTHHHASLNWLTPQNYIADIERTEALIGNRISRCFQHHFMAHRKILNARRKNIMPAANDDVLLAANDLQIAMFVKAAEIAAEKPAAGVE